MPRLFKVEFITKDTRLGASLVALEGIALGRPEITPIHGAKVSGKKVKAVDGGSLIESVSAELSHYKNTDITRRQLRELVERFGGSAASIGSLIHRLKERRVIKGKGIGHNGYKIIGG